MYRVYERGGGLLSKQRETYTMVEYKRVDDRTAIVVEEALDNEDREEEYIRAYLKTFFIITTH